jgi:uncharacterized membrane protein
MEAYLLDWASLLVRWLHLITGIAWIGASFYFVWLDNHLEPANPPRKGVAGEIWSVHGGGFYNQQKYLVAPDTLPTTLHWFKWEAYWTWISGFTLLLIVYYARADAMLIDKSVADLSSWGAIGISLGVLLLGLVVYEGLCRSPLGDNGLALGLVGFALIVLLAWGLTHVFSGRGAYMEVGVVLGTIMVANVAHIIIPGQRRMVASMIAGKEPDSRDGLRAKQRSVHNNYMTLPVVFIMISSHYPMTYGDPHAWLVLAVIFLAGALIRHFFNLRHKGRTVPLLPAAGVALLAALAVWLAPSLDPAAARGDQVTFAQVDKVFQGRCVACHSKQPTQPGFVQPPAGIILESPDRIKQLADRINQQVAVAKTMPPGNLTGITDEERALVGRWFAQGATVR